LSRPVIRLEQFQLKGRPTSTFPQTRRRKLRPPTGNGQGFQPRIEPLILIQDKGNRGMHSQWVIGDGGPSPLICLEPRKDLSSVTRRQAQKIKFGLLRKSILRIRQLMHRRQFHPNCSGRAGLRTASSGGNGQSEGDLWMRHSLENSQ
jgi:hypothetical protein